MGTGQIWSYGEEGRLSEMGEIKKNFEIGKSGELKSEVSKS